MQGAGISSPLQGQAVTVEGIVVGDYQRDGSAGRLGGFFLQEEDTDADDNAASSEGIFVFDGDLGVDVIVGQAVSASGAVLEFEGLTELSPATDVTVCDAGPRADANARRDHLAGHDAPVTGSAGRACWPASRRP